MADLSALSTEDLVALKSGDLSKVSETGLMALKKAQSGEMFPKVESQAAPRGQTGSFARYVGQEGAKGVMDTPAMIGEAGPFGQALNIPHTMQQVYRAATGDNEGSTIPSSRDIIDRGRKYIESKLGFQDLQPDGNAQRIFGHIARFAGGSVVPSAATIVRAARPLSAAAVEAMAALEGGAFSSIGGDVGADVGRHFGGDTGAKVGGVVGNVLGGATGTVTGGFTPMMVDKVRSVIGPNVSRANLSDAANALASREVGGALNANLSSDANMAQAKVTQDKLAAMGAGNFTPTLAQASGAPAITSLEANIARSSPEQLGKYTQNFSNNQKVIDSAVNKSFPDGGNISRAAGSTLRATSEKLDGLLTKIDTAQQDVAKVVSGKGQQSTGEMLQKLRDEAQTAARTVKDGKIADLYKTAAKSGESADMTDVLDAVTRLKNADPNTFQNMPPVFAKVINQYGSKEAELTGRSIPPDLMAASGITKNPQASFEELHSLYRETNSQLATAQRLGDANSTYFLGQLKDTLKSKLGAFEQGDGDLAKKFSGFNQWFSTKYAPAFYEGVGGKMAATNRYGEIVKPEAVVGKFFTPSGIDDFNLVFQGNRKAQDALKDGVLGLFKDAAIKDGRIDQAAAARFMRSNEEALAKIPDIASTLKGGNMMNDALAARGVRLRNAQSELDKTTLAKIAGEADNGKVVMNALSDPAYMKQLVATAKDANTQRAVARSIVEGIPQAAAKTGVDPLAFILSNEKTLKPLMDKLGPNHFDNLKTIASAQTINGRISPPKYVEPLTITGMAEGLTGSSPRTIWAQTANAAAGRQSPISGALFLMSRFLIKKTEDSTDNLLKGIIYNPELASEMAKSAKMPFSIGQSNRLSEHLANAGIRIAVNASQQPDQTRLPR